jgi:hypothetical protein
MNKIVIDITNKVAVVAVVFVLWLLFGITLSGYSELPSALNLIPLLAAGLVVFYYLSLSNKK